MGIVNWQAVISECQLLGLILILPTVSLKLTTLVL